MEIEMDLGIPLATLAGRLDGAVLTVLARSHAPLNGRELHRMLEGSASLGGVHGALRRMAERGLVLASSRRAETLYRANRDHLLWEAVEHALRAGAELRRRLRDLVEAEAPPGTSLILYGSVSRGDAHPGSDIDLLVVFRDTVAADDRDAFVDELIRRARSWTGNDVQTIQLDRSSLAASKGRQDPLVELWMTDGELLVDALNKTR